MINRLSNQRNSVQQLKSLARLEVGLAGLVLVLAVFAYNLYQQAQEAQDNQAAQDHDISVLRDDLVYFENNNDKEKLLEELEQLRAMPKPVSLPGHGVALSLGNAITEYARRENLPLTGFDRVDFVTTVGEAEFSAVKFTITAVGDEKRLTGILQLLREFPTALVRTLEFIRPLAEGEETLAGAWKMTLNVDVIYR